MSDFKTVLVRDSVIGDITADIDYAVKSGAAQTTYQKFPSTSSSNSAIIFNVQVPSENVVIGRDVLLTTGLNFTINSGSVDASLNSGAANPAYIPASAIGTIPLQVGNTDALQAFPLNSLFTTATAQINNTTVSINTQDVLPSLLRMNDSRELYRYNSMTPSLPDQAYANFSDGVAASNNALAGYANASYDLDQLPRGSFPLLVPYIKQSWTDASLNSNVATATLTSGTSNTYTTTWTINGTAQAAPTALFVQSVKAAGAVFVYNVQTVVTEPIFLSPFIWSNPEYNAQGLLGINNMSFTFNIDSTCRRLWSTANPYITSVVLGSPSGLGTSGSSVGFQTTYQLGSVPTQTAPALLFKFLSTQPSDLVETKNIVPYMDFPRYLTSASNSVSVAAGATQTITSSNLQINQIPDLFLINVRIPMSQQTVQNTSSFFTINNISINLNNQSGLLSSASKYDLWRMSMKNGSSQSWEEFNGSALKAYVSQPTASAKLVATTGSLLVINPAYDLSLPDYISSGSLGNYNFQFQCSVTNLYDVSIQPEIIITCVNSGIFTTQQGVSAAYTGILTKEMVLSAKSSQQASAMMSEEVSRKVGGKLDQHNAISIGRMMKHHMKGRGYGVSPPSSGGAHKKSKLSAMC